MCDYSGQWWTTLKEKRDLNIRINEVVAHALVYKVGVFISVYDTQYYKLGVVFAICLDYVYLYDKLDVVFLLHLI